MAEFSLPKNSKVKTGKKAYPATPRPRTFKVYRWSPDDDENPQARYLQSTWTNAARWFWTR